MEKDFITPHEFTMDCIYNALIQLMQKKRFEDISITEITKQAGVSRMAYYRNFKSKEDFLLRHLRSHIEPLLTPIHAVEEITEGDFWHRYVQEIHSLNLSGAMTQGSLSWNIFQLQKEVMQEIYTRIFGINLSNETNLRLFYQNVGLAFGVIVFRLDQPNCMNIERTAGELQRICMPFPASR